MWLSRTVDYINRIIRPVTLILRLIGGGLLAVMMFLTAGDVLLRYILNSPILGSYEISEYLMSFMIAFGIAYCATLGGHVSIEILVSRFSAKTQAIVGAITSFLVVVFVFLVVFYTFQYTVDMVDAKLVSAALKIPVFPFVGLVGFGLAIYWLTTVVDFLKFLMKVETT
jgi:TRAP-type C4-dicarboxylate transport system permease small subunit